MRIKILAEHQALQWLGWLSSILGDGGDYFNICTLPHLTPGSPRAQRDCDQPGRTCQHTPPPGLSLLLLSLSRLRFNVLTPWSMVRVRHLTISSTIITAWGQETIFNRRVAKKRFLCQTSAFQIYQVLCKYKFYSWVLSVYSNPNFDGVNLPIKYQFWNQNL